MAFKLSFTTLLMAGLAAHAQTPAAPKEGFKGCFRVGAARNQAQFEERDARGGTIVRTQFDTISPENVLKWESVHPRPDAYAFDAPDRYVAFGEKNHMFIVGHTLVWHSQVPAWVFQNAKGEPLDRDGLLQRMHDHIRTVGGRYKGRIRVLTAGFETVCCRLWNVDRATAFCCWARTKPAPRCRRCIPIGAN